MKELIESQEAFLRKFNISAEEFEKSGYTWAELLEIREAYLPTIAQLEHISSYVSNNIRNSQSVHTVRTRIKNPDHLCEKIVRKKPKSLGTTITKDNYSLHITDLVGVRILHLFKSDWLPIHEFISANWDLNENPKAYVRDGDSKDLSEEFKSKGCDVEEHPYGYRSIHYVLKINPSKVQHLVEIQVRTIFEEAWSEVDHQIRYPYDLKNKILTPYLILFNRFAGSADEMATYLKFLQQSLNERNEQHMAEIEEQRKVIAKLQKKVSDLNIEKREKESLETELRDLKARLTEREPAQVATFPFSDQYPGRIYNSGTGLLGTSGLMGQTGLLTQYKDYLVGDYNSAFAFSEMHKSAAAGITGLSGNSAFGINQ